MDERTFQLQEKIRRIEEDLKEVKQELGMLDKEKDTHISTEKSAPKSSTESSPALPLKKKTSKNAEKLIEDWLPRIFIFVFIMGIIWAFIAAMDRGWISPIVRILAGFALAGLLYWLGNRLFYQRKSALSIVLLGGSIVIYIAAVFAGNVLYDLIPYGFTLILLAAGMIFGVWMSRRYASESLLAIIGMGAYLYPFLFAGDRQNVNVFYLYETLIFVGLVLESIQKRYKITWNIANYAFLFAVLFFALAGVGEATLLTFLTLAFQQSLIIYLTFQVRHSTSKEMYIAAISAGALFLYLIGEVVFGPAEAHLYIFYLITAGVYGALSIVKSKSYHELKNVFFTFSMFYLFIFVTQLFNEQEYIRLLSYTVQAIIIYYLSQKRNSLLGTIASLGLLFPVLIELWELPGYNLTSISLVCWILTITFFLGIYLYRERAVVLDTSLISKGFPYVTAALVLVFFSKLSEWITYPGSSMDYNIGLSISWMVFVAVMYGAYGFFKENHWQYIGLVFLFITLGKLILLDLTIVDLVWRAVLFIVLGSIGLFISRIFYSKKEKEEP